LYANITDAILYQCKLNPWSLAICTPGSPIDSISYGELQVAVNNIAHRALENGLAPGQTVAVFMNSTIFHAATILALSRLGIVTVSGRLGKIPKELGIDAVIADEPNLFAGMKNVIGFDLQWSVGQGTAPDYESIHRSKDNDLCRIILTSGSTGVAKAVGFTHKMLIDRMACYAYSKGPSFSQGTRLFCDLGIGTSPGFRYLLYTLTRGGTTYFLGDDPTAILPAFDLHQIQIMTTSPHGLGEFVQFFEQQPMFECSLDYIVCQGAMLSVDLARRVCARMCQNLYSSYGSTEVGTVACGPASVLASTPGAVGYVEPHATIEILDSSGQELPIGREGVVRIRTRHRAAGYIGDPEATKTAFRDDAFYPGDFGRLTPEGLLVIGGREKPVLNLGGDIFKPEVIEEVLTAFSGIDEAAVLGMKNELGITQAWALITTRSPLNEAALRIHCQNNLFNAAVPVRFIVVDSIPRTDQGKIDRHRLQQLATEMAIL
jgi:acyl-CoA synthetase (AMP-forming)/AMP-acid ligase II